MTRQLTAQSSLESLKKEAKAWLKALRAGDADARRRFERAHPRAPESPGLRDVQHALAREHGVESWLALREKLDDLATLAQSLEAQAFEFLDLACLHYGVKPGDDRYTGYTDAPGRRQRALRLLAQNPALASFSLHTAVVAGDVAEVERILARTPSAVSEKGGREGWVALLFLCYGRLPTPAAADNAVAIAKLLLDHGADPNAHWTYLWDGNVMAWSAVCGAIGNGESGANTPSHPQADALVALLLERGGDVNQSQALYNTMLRGDDAHWLEVLVANGLNAEHRMSWDAADETTIFQYLLGFAIKANQPKRARFLLERGAKPMPTASTDRFYPNQGAGKSFYERALLSGDVELAELLAQKGAARSELAGLDVFHAACARGDGELARSLLAEHPEYMSEAGLLLVEQATTGDRVELARFLLELGVSPDSVNPEGGYRALHMCGCTNSVEVAKLLLERGAELDVLDAGNRSTPLGWALHTGMSGTIELFGRHSRHIFTLVASGNLERLRELLSEEPSLANAIAEGHVGLGVQGAELGDTPLHVLPDHDEELALEVALLLLASGADPERRNGAGRTPADEARARGHDDVAELLAP